MKTKFNFSIDRGGTFTDLICICPSGKVKTLKLLSEDPANYKDAPTEGIRRIIQEETGKAVDSSGLIDISNIGSIRMGTTVATNALLERKGEKVLLVVNEGFKDVLHIGNQARPKIFDLNIRKPSNLYEEVVEVNCRVIPARDDCEIKNSWKVVDGISDTKYLVTSELEVDVIRAQILESFKRGIRSIAVALAHSYACPDHELRIGEIAREIGFTTVTLSHDAMPMIRLVPRGFTSCAEAYLTPHVDRYLQSFRSGFQNNLEGVEVMFMQSDGGLTAMDRFRGARAILSGPAGGVIGYSQTGSRDTELPLIGFDMGGTSTDVSRFDGHYEHTLESTTAGVTIQAPQLDINTVAAGGGSRLFFRSGLYVVGPESAGANPGPTCYKKGGPLTVTDANLVTGRLFPEFFPKIFGKSEKEALDLDASLNEFNKITDVINQHNAATNQKTLSVQEVAMGFIRVANEAMCRPIRALTQSRGFDTSKHALSCFGGAGGQHACAIAKDLGMKTVLIHKYSGILSAYGMALADVVHEAQKPCGLVFSDKNFVAIAKLLDDLSQSCVDHLKFQGFDETEIDLEPYLHLRYNGTDCALMIAADKSNDSSNLLSQKYGDFFSAFVKRYQKEFGFTLEGRSVVVDDVRVRGCGKSKTPEEQDIEASKNLPEATKTAQVFFDDSWIDTKIFIRENLFAGHSIVGPAVIIDRLSTIIIEPNCTATITKKGDIVIVIDDSKLQKVVGVDMDPIQLSIFSHRFMSIAEQMGRVLQRTSISTNIKERLDFSCALFGPDGGLVSNAPHIPVHLGAMQETVRYQIEVRGKTLKDGDVLLSNHPQAGGSHLPDLTVITPVFYPNVKDPVFFVASRGHHADIGGISPGSMPPHSKTLADEGAAFKTFLLVDGGLFNEEGIVKELTTPTGSASCGTRNLADNISDLKAQIAANHRGIQLVRELIDIYSLQVVQAFMGYIQKNASECVRDMLKEIAADAKRRNGSTVLHARELMDDGSPIELTVTINEDDGTAVFDFTGTGHEVYGNCNAPRAITFSAIIYCLRAMVGFDIPLNQGCLNPIQVIIPKNSILDPSDGAAVVGGNVLTSQRIVDTILKAFAVCSASCGCMNNVTIGDDNWGYYETVGGGSGAGPTWNGSSGVHTHMTNTRITDLEILEQRYPIVLKKFSLRTDGSGGDGYFKGGEGVQRELLFRKPVTLSVLTERRAIENYGLEGGAPGKLGLNLLKKSDGRIVSLGGKAAISIETGDVFSMLTPGGGGYGKKSEKKLEAVDEEEKTFYEKGSVFAYRMMQESV